MKHLICIILSGDKLILEIFLYTALGDFAVKETCVFSVGSKLRATCTYTHIQQHFGFPFLHTGFCFDTSDVSFSYLSFYMFKYINQ